jgi:hypothetical protein
VLEIKKTKYREKADFAILASAFYSECKKEKLLALTKYQYWVSLLLSWIPIRRTLTLFT